MRRDLNATIATGGQWKIPAIWGFVLKYNTAPIVAIIFSFAFPRLYQNRGDPLMAASFAFMSLVILSSISGLIFPRFFNFLVPSHKVPEGDYPIVPGVIFSRANTMGELEIEGVDAVGSSGVDAHGSNGVLAAQNDPVDERGEPSPTDGQEEKGTASHKE